MIYLSDLLPAKYPEDFKSLGKALENHNIPYHLLSGTKDIWLRDFMPVRTKSGKLVCFRYEPSYLEEDAHLRTDYRENIAPHLDLPVEYSDINLDGGNVVFSPSRDKAIISNRIFSENPNYAETDLVAELSKQLEAEVIIIPSLKSDMTGHADGMVRFVDENTVIGNDNPGKKNHEKNIKDVLEKSEITVIDFPYFYLHSDSSAVGCYLNYLEVGDLVLLPVFGIEMDGEAVEKAKAVFQGKTVVPVLIPDIAKEGGCLNCISWEI